MACVMCMSCMFAADIISCVEFNADGELLATGDKGGRVVIFQRDQLVNIDCILFVMPVQQSVIVTKSFIITLCIPSSKMLN